MKYNLMAKSKTKTMVPVKDAKKKKMKGGKKMVRSPTFRSDLDTIARHISDPCNSDLNESGLPGQKGIISRFVMEQNIELTAGATASLTYLPATSTYSLDAVVGSSSVYTPNVLVVGGPGTTFLGGSSPIAASYRPLGACVEVFNYTPTVSRGGMWAILHTPANTINNVPTTTDNQFACANERGTFGDGSPVQALWRPGYLDDTYGIWDDLRGESTDLTDRNSVTVALLAGASDQSIRVRMTLVCEWVPRVANTANGIVTPLVGSSTHNIKSSQVVAVLDHYRPNWWSSALRKMGSVAVQGLNTYMASKGLPSFL
nr:MAG: hypothetical protein [Narnaviridae sp.]